MKKNLNLIILDDDKVQRYAVRRQLASDVFKFNIFEADRGEVALKILKNHFIDCIIVDYMLPQYDGLFFIKQVKEIFGSCPPFLLITAFGTGDIIRQAFKNGCFDYISKDKLNSKDLLTAVLALAEHAQAKNVFNEKIENLELLAAEVTHDLSPPLRSINYSIMQIGESNIDRADIHVNNHLTNIKSNVKNLYCILNDISNSYANKDSGISLTMVDMNELISSVIESILNTFPDKLINFSVGYLPIIKADKSGIFRIFYNLISNGIKYNQESKISIKIYHESTTLYDEIVIHDNGIGMSTDSLKNIFKLYYRAQDDSDIKGTGLGLAICKKIVEQHNGKIFVESELGQGSKFRVAIPHNMNA